MQETLPALEMRKAMLKDALATAKKAMKGMDRPRRQFFFENLALGVLFDLRPVEAAIFLVNAMSEPEAGKAFELCERAMKPLEKLEVEIMRAERPPFEGWYRMTWIRKRRSRFNVHRPFLELRAFLSSSGKRM